MRTERSRSQGSEARSARHFQLPHRAGFTLIELLVVITIITMLAGLLIGGVIIARRRASVMTMKTFLNALDVAIENYEPLFGDYPPGAGDEESAELLYEALTTEKEGYNPFPFKSSQTVDLDNDGRLEICDHWLQPLIYIDRHHRGEEDEMDAPKGKLFLIISAGLDGEYEAGKGDDITNWK